MNNNKKIILNHCENLNSNDPEKIKLSVKENFADNFILDAYHPLNQIKSSNTYLDEYLLPLYASFRSLIRRNDILIGGDFLGKTWVSTTGYLVGIFQKDYMGIPATGKITHLRFGESFQFIDGKITRSLLIIDLIDLIRQSGYNLLPPDLGSEMLIPGPQTQDGIVLTNQDEKLTAQTLQIVEDMLFKGLMNFDGKDFSGMNLKKYWHPEFMWYGPAGIGSSQGIDGFQAYHQIPFLTAFPDRKGGNHDVRFADGFYAVSSGWPSLFATHKGSGWLGLAASDKKVTMRVMDWWRQKDGLLVENWVFIDIIELFLQIGINLFERLEILKTHKKNKIN